MTKRWRYKVLDAMPTAQWKSEDEAMAQEQVKSIRVDFPTQINFKVSTVLCVCVRER
jgi:hypothetical protein